jgi:hypothetical protein
VQQSRYAPGHSQRELERLTRQAQVFEPFTRQLLQLAGITSGMRVLGMFRAAGLPEPSLRMDTLIGGGPGCIGYQLIAEVVETLLPEIEKRQIATAAEVEISTLARRMCDKVVTTNGVILSPGSIGAWSRKSAPLVSTPGDTSVGKVSE